MVPLLKGPCFAPYEQLHPVCLIRKAHTKATTTASSLGSLSWPTWPKEVLYASDTGHLPRVPQVPCLLAFPVMLLSQLNYTSCEKLVPLLKGPCIVIIYIHPALQDHHLQIEKYVLSLKGPSFNASRGIVTNKTSDSFPDIHAVWLLAGLAHPAPRETLTKSPEERPTGWPLTRHHPRQTAGGPMRPCHCDSPCHRLCSLIG